ncbi:MAG: DNA-directed RNA polymerase subunit alpha [Rickettsia sp.]|nr:DNA-directed RNA polymerase subunit alpha [Rickettsia sp.]
MNIENQISQNWKSLIKPQKILYKKGQEIGEDFDLELSSNSAQIIIEPLERGFGHTLGNALRRVLLSSLQGAAITAIKIEGISHEFSVKEGVKENIVDLILNLKSIILKMVDSEFENLKLNVKGPKIVTAGLIESNSKVTILNEDLYICTLAEGYELRMDLFCETGKRYVPAADQKENDLGSGIIRIDSLFNPVKKVSYETSNARVGEVTDYDKLVLNVQTNGSISPENAVAFAAKIMQDQLKCLITFQDVEEKIDTKTELEYNPVLLKKIAHLELSVRSQNCLQNDNIVYIGDLVVKTEAYMLKAQNFGRKSLNEIKAMLSKFNLSLGMNIPNWPPKNAEELAKKYEDLI